MGERGYTDCCQRCTALRITGYLVRTSCSSTYGVPAFVILGWSSSFLQHTCDTTPQPTARPLTPSHGSFTLRCQRFQVKFFASFHSCCGNSCRYCCTAVLRSLPLTYERTTANIACVVAHLHHPRLGSSRETGLDVDRPRACEETPAPPHQTHSESRSCSSHSASQMRLSRILQGLPPKTAPADFSRRGGSGRLCFSNQ